MSAGTNKVSGSAAGGEGLRKISEAMDGRREAHMDVLVAVFRKPTLVVVRTSTQPRRQSNQIGNAYAKKTFNR